MVVVIMKNKIAAQKVLYIRHALVQIYWAELVLNVGHVL